MAIDEAKLGAFLNVFVTDLGATVAAGNVVVGHRLGLYKALAEGPATAEQLAARTDTNPRYVTEWLRGQAAGGYAQYDPTTEQFSLTEEQAFVLTDPDGAVYAPGAFVLALGALQAEGKITERFRTGDGLGWHEQHEDVFVGCEQFFRPGYIANLVPSWIPALDGVEAKLTAGATVADLGCGLGRVDRADGPGVPRVDVRGLGLPRGVDRAGRQARQRRRGQRAGVVRGRLRG